MTEPVLTHREWLVLCLWISGASRRQIADSLGIGSETARSYVKSISRKHGLRGQFDAIRLGANVPRLPPRRARNTPELSGDA